VITITIVINPLLKTNKKKSRVQTAAPPKEKKRETLFEK
jgi:hypothetical protein